MPSELYLDVPRDQRPSSEHFTEDELATTYLLSREPRCYKTTVLDAGDLIIFPIKLCHLG